MTGKSCFLSIKKASTASSRIAANIIPRSANQEVPPACRLFDTLFRGGPVSVGGVGVLGLPGGVGPTPEDNVFVAVAVAMLWVAVDDGLAVGEGASVGTGVGVTVLIGVGVGVMV
jgi:hypothetical protein